MKVVCDSLKNLLSYGPDVSLVAEKEERFQRQLQYYPQHINHEATLVQFSLTEW